MEPFSNQISRASVSLMMLVLAILAVVIPFSSRTKTEVSKRPPLVLRTDAELRLLLSDRDRNQTEDWKDMLLETMGTTTKEQLASFGIDEKAEARLADKNNISASFSKNIYTAAAYVTQNPGLSEEEKTALVADAVKSEAPKIETKVYSPSEISISSSNSVATKKAYGNGMALLLKRANDLNLGSNELLMLQTYTEKSDATILTQLSTKKENVDLILKELLTISVPLSASIFHLRLVNSVSSFSMTLDAFSRADSDPLRSLAFLNAYPEMLTSLLTSMSDTQDYFLLEKVPFERTEPGYIFINRE